MEPPAAARIPRIVGETHKSEIAWSETAASGEK